MGEGPGCECEGPGYWQGLTGGERKVMGTRWGPLQRQGRQGGLRGATLGGALGMGNEAPG